MTENIEHKIDRTDWQPGPWDGEPDRLDFTHGGFACLLLRNAVGCWCGYVGVPESHPYFGRQYKELDVEVHGGLTYADECSPPICHIPEPGMPEKVWWLGFDTAHCFDLAPASIRYYRTLPNEYRRDDVYRDMEYAKAETMRLADQLARMI